MRGPPDTNVWSLPPGHPDSLVSWKAVARLSGTVVLMMAVENAPASAAALVDGGRPVDTPVAVIANGSLPSQRVLRSTLGALADHLTAENVKPPAIIVIGAVAAF